jgi:hypothetical protein
MDYDSSRLVVWPEWLSSGIWHPHIDTEKSAVRMVSHETLELPEYLSARFSAWITWYDDYQPEAVDNFPWIDFENEGRVLAFELARFVGDEYVVAYKGEKIRLESV